MVFPLAENSSPSITAARLTHTVLGSSARLAPLPLRVGYPGRKKVAVCAVQGLCPGSAL